MGDTMKKVKSGDPLVVPAQTFNSFVDAARDFQGRRQNQGSSQQQAFYPSGIVPVKNASGSDLGRFSVLGLDGPVYTPSDNEDEFVNHVALSGSTPDEADHLGGFCVLMEPLADGAIGRACILGVCPVKVDVVDADHPYADIKDGDSGQLESGWSGAARILWKEAGTGSKWAYVGLGAGSDRAQFQATVIAQPGSHGGEYTLRPTGQVDDTNDFQAQRIGEQGTTCDAELVAVGRYVDVKRNMQPDATLTSEWVFTALTWPGA